MHVEAGRHLLGGARQVGYLLDGLARAGVDNVLVCHPAQPLAASAAGVDVVTTPMRGDADVAVLGRLRRQIAARAPDLVHVHSRRGAELYAGIASRLERRPAVLTRRVDSDEFGPWARLKYRPYRAIVAISSAVEAQLRDGVGVDAARIERIASAVDTERFRPDAGARRRLLDELGLPDDALTLGVVAQLIPRKGHRRLLDGLPALLARHARVRVVCFGAGPEEPRLRRAAAALGVDAHVTFAGYRNDIERLLPGLDVVVHPAEREGLGVAVLEAMSAEVPVVAAAAGGLADVIRHGDNGLLFDPAEPAALVDAVDALARDASLRRRLGRAARATVEREHSVDGMVRRYLDLYRKVCPGR